MSASAIAISINDLAQESVEIFAVSESASDTGTIVIYNDKSQIVTQSASFTLYQSSTTIMITGLKGNTAYTAVFESTIGGNPSNAVSFVTLGTKMPLYGGKNGEAKLITKIYGGAEGAELFTGTIVPGEHPQVTAFSGNVFCAKMRSDRPSVWINRDDFDSLVVSAIPNSPIPYVLSIVLKDSVSGVLVGGTSATMESYGISINQSSPTFSNDDRIELTSVEGSTSRQIIKLYGSVRELTSLSGTISEDGVGNLDSFNGETFRINTLGLLNPEGTIDRMIVTHFYDDTWSAWVYYSPYGSGVYTEILNRVDSTTLVSYGITPKTGQLSTGNDIVFFEPTYSQISKLIHQGFGHSSYN